MNRILLATLVVVAGLFSFAQGFLLEFSNPRTNAQDNLAWFLLALGACAISCGVALPFVRPSYAIAIGIVAAPYAFVLAVILVWTVIALSAMGLRF